MKLWQAAVIALCFMTIFSFMVGVSELIIHLSAVHTPLWGIGGLIMLLFVIMTLFIYTDSNSDNRD